MVIRAETSADGEAIAAVNRAAFEQAGPLGIEPPFDAPSEAWMVARLAAYDDALRGVVEYPPAFEVVS